MAPAVRAADASRAIVGRLFGRAVLLALAATFPFGRELTAQHEHNHTASLRTTHAPLPEPVPVGPPRLPNEADDPDRFVTTLRASLARTELVAGMPTTVYAFNGRVPGPLLELSEGQRVEVRFFNDLPEPTTVHWHGLHLPVTSDGSPFDPVAPGDSLIYSFTVPYGSAGTYWYHPHPHHRTGYQVAMGLYGPIVVRAADDPIAHLPEQLIVLSDNRFRPDGSIDLSDPLSIQGRVDFENGREGDVIFVNGLVQPNLTIRSGEVQRWRVINASAARVYRLALDGHTFLHVGSDGGLFERPVSTSEILIANGERVELLVRGTRQPGDEAQLYSLGYDRYIPQTRPSDWSTTRILLTLSYSDDPPVPALELPDVLRSVPALDSLDATATRLMVLTQGMINGKLMDPARVDVEATLGATEIWEIENLVGMDHPFHLHGFQFQVLDRDGVPESFRSWKDTVNIPRHGRARFIVRYDDYPGRWMFHCHILDHEDHGMMGILEVK